MHIPLITNIQHYSIHDGHGIRTTVFFKGCPLSCAWCHNPETQSVRPTILFYEERCSGCQLCGGCPQGAISYSNQRAETDRTRCIACGSCIDECLNNARELCGVPYYLPELVKELRKDAPFYEESGGGVTLSGGEVMAQDMDYLLGLLRSLAACHIPVNIDTCGAVPFERFQAVLPYVDTFLYDLKLMDDEQHRTYVGASNQRILENLQQLSRSGAKLWIRLPIIGGINDTQTHIRQVGDFLRSISYQQVHLLPYHRIGGDKYSRLGRAEGTLFQVPAAERLEQLKETLEKQGISPVIIGG